MYSITELSGKYRTRSQCLKLIEELRFPEGPACLRCGSMRISRIRTVQKLQCMDCRYMFSVTSGTIFHRSHIPLQKWILAIFMICNAKKGISAKQIQRDLRLTYKSAWYLMHRIRRAMRETGFLRKFTGIVEADESYLGGKSINRWRRRRPRRSVGPHVGKMIVLGALERGGQVRLQMVNDATHKTISRFVKTWVSRDAEMLVTDEWKAYVQLRTEYRHERIRHQYEYVRGQIHTNSMENFWSILKRGITGVYHKVSRDYLPLYLSEFSYRFNHRDNKELFLQVIKNGVFTDRATLMNLP